MELTVNNKKLKLHFLTVVGSTLHKLNGENSDLDCKGVFTWEQDVVNSLVPPPEQLDNKNMKKEDRAELMVQLNEKFNREFDDDLDLFHSRKFFKNAMKSEPNMLDMLWADTQEGMVLFCTPEFQKVLDNRKLFVNFNQAKQRFLGMSFNCLKLGTKENGRSKDLAKSLQSLMSFKNMVLTGEFNPVLPEAERLVVQSVKEADNTESLKSSVLSFRQKLEDECNVLELPEPEDNFGALNKLLLDLHK